MWKNIRITSKLLFGFGLLLFVFVIAAGLAWRAAEETNRNSIFLSSAVIPSLTTGIEFEREIYEVFMSVKDVQSAEDDASIKLAAENLAKAKKVMDGISELHKKYPALTSTKYIVETIEPLLRQYTDITNKTFDTTRRKRELFSAMAKLGDDMIAEIVTNVDDVYHILRQSVGNADNARLVYLTDLLNSTAGQEDYAMKLRLTLQTAITNDDVASLRNVVAQLDKIKENIQKMSAASKTPEQKARNDRMMKTTQAFETNIKGYIDALVRLENISAERYKLRDAINEATTKASTMGFDHTKDITDAGVKELDGSIRILITSAGAAIVLGLLIAVLISRSIAKPLGVIVELAARAGAGDLTIERADFNYEGKDELANLSDAIYDMISSQEGSMREVVEVAESLIGGAHKLSDISEESNASMEEIKASIDQVSSLGESNGAALEECNAGVEEMSAGADTVAHSATESAAFISQTTDGSNKAANMVKSTTKGMRDVEVNSKENETKIKQLVDSIQNVSGFVSVITGIADQTNLLALNAAIEAARAGEAGRGFAVVAEEVRTLAEESAGAAQNVNSIITELQKSAQGSIDAAAESGRVLSETLVQAEQARRELDGAITEINKANDSIQNIAAVAEEQAISSREVAAGIDKATKSTIEMADTISGIRGAADITAMAARNVAEQAEAITQYSERLSGVLSRFKLRDADSKYRRR